MKKIINEEVLEQSLYDHPLKGKMLYFRECHIEPDWLLIYQIKDDYVIFIRTGSHSDLFK